MTSITQSTAPCHVPADAEDVLLGVDIHKDVHAAAVITVLGSALDGRSFPAAADGYRQLLDWARSFGVLRRAGVECTGSYGAALTRHLRAEGIRRTRPAARERACWGRPPHLEAAGPPHPAPDRGDRRF